MAYDSAIAAIVAFYQTLNGSAFPAVCNGLIAPGPYLDDAPKAKNAAAKMEPPYVVIVDGGSRPQIPGVNEAWDFAGVRTDYRGSFTLRCYALDAGDAAAITKAILFNGQLPELKAGLAFCTSLLLNPPLVPLDFGTIVPRDEVTRYAGYDIRNERVHYHETRFDRRLLFNPGY